MNELEKFLNKFVEDTKHISENEDFKSFIKLINNFEPCPVDSSPVNSRPVESRPVENRSDESNCDLLNRYIQNQKEKDELEREISNLSEKEKQNFWANYHNIPTQSGLHDKLDVLINSISSMNGNIVENFSVDEKLEELISEIQILRKEVRSHDI